jgi:hypothetical protein
MRPVRSVKYRVGRAAIGCVGYALVGMLAACGGGGGGSGGGGSGLDPTATFTATPIATSTRTVTSTSTPTATPSPSRSPSVTVTHAATPTVSFTATPMSTPKATATLTATLTATITPTSTPLTGPVVTAFGIADSTGTINVPVIGQGLPVFSRQTSAGFIIFVEGRPGPSQLPVGTHVSNSKVGDPTQQPDLQIESSNDLGNSTQAVCDNSFPALGGVPAVNPPDFSAVQSVSDALNDFGCRFKVFAASDFACTQDASGNLMFDNPSSTVQFCTLVNEALTFPGDATVLTLRLRDTAGNIGPPAQIVVRITGG